MDVFIGYDHREPIAFHTCANSIIRYASKPVAIRPLALNTLKGYTESHTDGSNAFIYSRFLVPWLMKWTGPALFIDGDMVVREDISKLFDQFDQYKAVQVVKHDYKSKASTKYLGNKNEDYPRKNWSSVILWNCWHYKNRTLFPEYVASQPGSHLHRFGWLDDAFIGDLEPEWNWLPDEYGENQGAKLLHWTLGTPCFPEYKDAPQADVWHTEQRLATLPMENHHG